MRKLRYAIFDTFAHQWLMRVDMLPTAAGPVLYTVWTDKPAEAQRFPGVKSARGMMARIGNGLDLIVLNGRGKRVG